MLNYMKSLNESGMAMTTDAFSERLSEANDFFSKKYHTNIIGSDFESVVSNDALFEAYAQKLTEGFEETANGESLQEMLTNTRAEILREASMSGIQPFNSLAMPMIVKLWARLSMTNAIPTKPTKTPSFTVPFLRPYIADADGTKHYLPESINNTPETMIKLKALTPKVVLTEGKVSEYDLFTGITVRAGIDKVDRKFRVIEATFSDAKDAKATALNGQSLIADGTGALYGEVEYTNTSDALVKDTLMGRINLDSGTLTLVSLSGKVSEVKIQGSVSSEQHSSATQVGLDLTRTDINIGTSQHIEATLPIEFLQDVNAMYDIDGAAVITENMSAISSQKVDLDLIEFLERSLLGTDAAYTRKFNVYPNSTYSMHPSEWLKGLRQVIDNLSTNMKNDYKVYDAYFVIVGNPLDTDLLPNVDWTFRQAENTVAGIDVNYSIGALRGSNTYKIISSDLIPQGELTVFAVPTRDNFLTYVYYPYTFNVTKDYLNSNNPNVPSLMMTRRYETQEFAPIIGKVVIENNDGSVYSR